MKKVWLMFFLVLILGNMLFVIVSRVSAAETIENATLTSIKEDADAPVISNINITPVWPGCAQRVDICADVVDASAIISVGLSCSSPRHELTNYMNLVSGDRYCTWFATDTMDAETMSCVINATDTSSNHNSRTAQVSPFTYDCARPLADIESPIKTFDEGQLVSFNGSGSYDSVTPTNELLYLWDFGDATPSGSGMTPSHVYADNGLYFVRLTVTDYVGISDNDGLEVTITDRIPTANAGEDQTVLENESVNFTGNYTDDPSDLVTLYEWDFSYVESEGFNVESLEQNPTYVYNENGSYTAAFRVKDEDSYSNIDTLTLTVKTKCDMKLKCKSHFNPKCLLWKYRNRMSRWNHHCEDEDEQNNQRVLKQKNK